MQLAQDLAAHPRVRLLLSVSDGNHQPLITMFAVDDLIWIATHQIEAMPVIAKRKSMRIGADHVERFVKLCLKSFGRPQTPLRIPAESFREIPFSGGRNSGLPIKPSLATSALADLRPGRRRHPSRIQFRRPPFGLDDPFRARRRPLVWRNRLPQGMHQSNPIRGRQSFRCPVYVIKCSHRNSPHGQFYPTR